MMPTPIELDVVEPPFSQWKLLLEDNIASIAAGPAVVGGISRAEAKREIIEHSLEFTRTLFRTAKSAAIPLEDRVDIHDGGSPCVMTGHQAVVYHPGLSYKEQLLNEFAASVGATPVSITIDTDEERGGHITWPLISAGELVVREGSISGSSASLLIGQTVAPSNEVRGLFAEMCADLAQSGLSEEAHRAHIAGQRYAALAGLPLVEAHSIVRRSFSGYAHLELPLSRVCALPAAQKFLNNLIADAECFAGSYNRCLDSYRQSHNIKNAANPFPNMRISEDSIELPLWTLKSQERQPFWRSRSNQAVPTAGDIIIPKGSIVTLFLRGFCSELFIHGLGGGKYDRFVDELAEAYLSLQLPAFVVASRTRYVVPDRVRELQGQLELRHRLKEMISHTEKFLGCGHFSGNEEGELRTMVASRKKLLERLGAVVSTAERSEVAHELNALNKAIRTVIESTSLYSTVTSSALSEATLARWRYRGFPDFLFAPVPPAEA